MSGLVLRPVTNNTVMSDGDKSMSHKEEIPSMDSGSMSESDSESEDDSTPKSQHITQRRRIQNAIFSTWYCQQYSPIIEDVTDFFQAFCTCSGDN
jgi:hypothetical protein